MDQPEQREEAVFEAALKLSVAERAAFLEVIKLGMDTKQVIARFDAERQALAMMDHPNISAKFSQPSSAPLVTASSRRLRTRPRGSGIQSPAN